jgi:hypothetical protein
MADQLYLGKIDLKVCGEHKKDAFVGEKGIYLDVSVWVSDEPNKIGKHVTIKHRTKDGQDVYLGNAEKYVKGQGNKKSEDPTDDLPF